MTNDEIKEFDAKVKKIIDTCSVAELHAACYLCNFEDEYICHIHDGGCNCMETCRNINKILGGYRYE